VRIAYGLRIPSGDAEFTHVGPGIPCGELMPLSLKPIASFPYARFVRALDYGGFVAGLEKPEGTPK